MTIYLFFLISLFIFSIGEFIFSCNLKIIQKFYIFIIFVVFVFNRENNDYENYVRVFNFGSEYVEKGYLYLNILIKKLGGNYHIILFILGLLLIFIYFYLYSTKYKISLIFLYSFSSLIYDINQIRNLFCVLFIIIGLYFLFNNKNKIYLFFNFLAISFQRIGYIYILFYILQKFRLKNYFKIVIIIFFSGFLGVFLFEKVSIFLFPHKAYYFSSKPNLGMFLYYFLILIDIFLLKISVLKHNKEELYIKFILFQIIFLPYSLISIELINRIWRNTLFIKWYYYFKFLHPRNKLKKNIICFSLLLLQQLIYIIVLIYKNPEGTFSLLSQIGNIFI